MFKMCCYIQIFIELQKMNKIQDDNTSIFIENVDLHPKISRFQMIASPQAFSRINSVKSSHQKRNKSSPFQLGSLLQSKRGPNIKKINYNRQTYRQIKQKIAKALADMQSSKKNLNLGEVMLWKQEVLASFMNQYLVEIEKECKEKADILLFIWNSVFNIIDWLFEVIAKLNKQEQKDYLNNLIDNHKSYQSIIENLNYKIAKKEQEYARQQEFIKALVYNLRFKRKQIKKLSKNLKVCTFRLNEIKDFYLDLQVEHIELLSENRDISKENAKELVVRKQEINLEKRKEFKLKQSHKKIRFMIQNEILNENALESQNVDKLNEDLQVTFQKYYQKNKKTGQKINYPSAQNIFQNALDDFNVRIQEVPETESLIDYKSNISHVDAETDMVDFVFDVEDKATEITFNDRLFQDMISHASIQTQEVKPKQKVYEDRGQQINFPDMKAMSFTRVRVYDRSYLLEDYRDKRYKNERGIGLKLGQEKNLMDSRDNYYNENRLKSRGFIKYRDSKQLICDSAVQTEEISFMLTQSIPLQLRNLKLQKEIQKYFEKMNNYVLRDKTKDELNKPTRKMTVKTKSMIQSEQENSLQLDTLRNASLESVRKKKVNLLSARYNSKNKYRVEMHSSQSKLNDLQNQIESIEENKYEHLASKEYQNSNQVRSATVSRRESAKKQKFFWFMKPEANVIYQKKQKFLNDLNKGDQLLCKTSIYKKSDAFMENKKILAQLQRLSEEMQHMSNAFGLIEENVQDNMGLLREQLKKMLSKKRNNRKLALSRQQSLCRIISFVYTYAYHLYFNHKKELQNLIIPLFHHFKIGYGEIKKNDLYLRMLYFLSQTICHQSQYYIFQSFILFLGLNITGERHLKVGHQTTCLYLKLLHRLSVNFRFPLNVQQLYTTIDYFDQKCRQILIEQRFEQSIIEKIIQRVKLKQRSINENQCTQEEDTTQFKETKLNVFKCCEFIIQEVQKIKNVIEESYEGVLGYFKKEGEMGCKQFVSYVLNNCYFAKEELNKRVKLLDELQSNASPAKFLHNLGKTFMQLKVPNFQKLYYIALSKYKIKEEFLYLSLNRRLNFMINYLKKYQKDFQIEQILVESIIGRKDSTVLKQQTTKRILALAYLRIVENQSQNLVKGMLGNDLQYFL